MPKIYFKNGDVAEDVPQEILDALKLKIINAASTGAKHYQCFSDDKGKTLLIINLSEVNYIR